MQGKQNELVVVIAKDEAIRKLDRRMEPWTERRGCSVGKENARSDEGRHQAPVGMMGEVAHLYDVVVGQRAAVGGRKVLHVALSVITVQAIFGADHDVAVGTLGKSLHLLARQAVTEFHVVVPGHAIVGRKQLGGGSDEQHGKQNTHANE